MRRTQKLSPLIPPSDNNHPVTVVPMLAPMMTWIACLKFISPEFTNPTTITVVAEELWIIAVTPSPVRNPANFPVVIFESKVRSLFPALLSSASPMTFMPKRNRHNPPINVSTSNKSILHTSLPDFTNGRKYSAITSIQNKCKICREVFVKFL